MDFVSTLITALGSSTVTAIISRLMNRGKEKIEVRKLESDINLSEINFLIEKYKDLFERELDEYKQKLQACEDRNKELKKTDEHI
jgi:uncharacterized protein (DUF342 family)